MSATNKQFATTFLQLAASGNVREAYDNYVAPNFCHHNPYFAGDAASLAKGWKTARINSPTKSSKSNASLKTAIW